MSIFALALLIVKFAIALGLVATAVSALVVVLFFASVAADVLWTLIKAVVSAIWEVSSSR